MKKRFFVLLLAALMLLAVGCGGSEAPASEAPSSEAAEVPQEGSVRGVVVDATMNTVTIQVPNGSEYTFPTEGAEVSAEGILVDDEVTIQYTGTFDDATQVQDVTVTAVIVEVSAAGDASAPVESQAPEAPVEDVKSLQGTIDQYDGGDTMMVVDATGVDFLFSLEGADLHVGEEGFAVGDEVIVYYYGDLVDKPEVQDVQVGEVKKADQ